MTDTERRNVLDLLTDFIRHEGDERRDRDRRWLLLIAGAMLLLDVLILWRLWP